MTLSVVAAAVVGSLLVGCSSESPEAQTVEVVVPPGTADRLRAGEDVVIMPLRIELSVGDYLVIRNEDDEPHLVGPYEVRADSVNQFTFGAAGNYEGYCPLSEGDRYEIVVTP